MNRRQMLLLMGSRAPIYGASWAGGSSPTLTRTDAAVGMVAAAGVDAGVVVNSFDNADIYRNITEVTDALGNVFVRIPRFWIEKTAVGAARTWRISSKPFGNAYLPACFANAAYVDVGKYNAALDVGTGTKLTSISGSYPLINKNIVEFRGYAQANGAGYYQMDVHVADIIRTLFYVEFSTLNSQSIMAGLSAGAYAAGHTATAAETAVNRIVVANATAALFVVGQTIGVGTSLGGNEVISNRTVTSIDVYDASNKAITVDGAAFNIAVGNIIYSLGWKSGFSSGIVAKSGSPTHATNGLYPCMYRGIENPWGSVWQFIDGLNINENQAWVCRTPADYASNLFAAPYVQLSYVCKNANGYPISMGLDPANPFANLPSEVGGGSTTYYSDYYYQAAGQRMALLGGAWNYGAAAGLSYWSLADASSNAHIRIGGRLLKTPL